MFRLRISCVGLCLLAATAGAQTADVRTAWNAVSTNLIGAAVKMPSGNYDFHPTPDTRSFAELIGHVADTQAVFCGALLPGAKAPAGAAKLTNKDELVRALEQSTALCTAALDRTTDSDSLQTVKFFGRERMKLALLWANVAHDNEHYGNVVTYLRLKGVIPPSSDPAMTKNRVYYDQAHGEMGVPPEMAEVATRAGFQVIAAAQPITAEVVKKMRVVYLRAPSKAFSDDEKTAIVGFVKGGGSLLLVLDEEQRQSLSGTGVNDLIEPFGMKLTPDTPYVHNCGAMAKAGEINAADREIPYSGGRAIEGGTPFAFQLDKAGKPAQAFAAWKKVGGGGKVIVMAEGMASLFLGTKEGERLSGVPRDPARTVYWGKDSPIFMEEVLAWLVRP